MRSQARVQKDVFMNKSQVSTNELAGLKKLRAVFVANKKKQGKSYTTQVNSMSSMCRMPLHQCSPGKQPLI